MTTTVRTRPAGHRNGIPVQFYVWRGPPPKPRPAQPKPPRARKSAKPKPWFSANRGKTHCPKKHLYDDANTYRDRSGRRHCRACQRERFQQQSQAKSAQRSGVELADPCVAAVIDALNRIPRQNHTRAEIAALAVSALRQAGLLPPNGAAQ
jgi:hypothetical protein